MSDAAAAPGANGPWPVLDVNERRVLGVLVEKQKTLGSDAYPMSLNALVTGSNQKSNRDPILDLDEDEVEDALMRCKNRGLAAKVIGGRVERWRHLLYEVWHVDKLEMAVLGELLLRGPQTEGELRTRASRMDNIEDLETLKRVLRPLVERKLVVYLTPEDRRGAMLTHGFHEPGELSRLRTRHASSGAPVESSASSHSLSHVPSEPARTPSVSSRSDDRVEMLEAALRELRQELQTSGRKIDALESQVRELHQELEQTQQDLKSLKAALGV